MSDQIVKMRERWLLGRTFQSVECTSAELIVLQKLIQLPTLFFRQLRQHGVEQSAVNDSADVPGKLIERTERGQLEALAYQLFDGDIDQIGWVVQMVWPPVSIKGRRYMDGGLRSSTNADLAVGYASVVIITPMSPENPGNESLAKELRVLEQSGATMVLLRADAEAIASFGPNALDPAFRVAAAEAGLRQAGGMANELRAKLATAL